MPNTYRKLGVEFQYPDNWQLDEEEALAGNHSVSVYSPEGGFWSIAIHARSINPRQLIDAVRRAMSDVYPDLDAEEVAETIGGQDWIGYDMYFICLDLTNTARVRCRQTAGSTLVVFCQAEDREFARIGDVFRAVTASIVG